MGTHLAIDPTTVALHRDQAVYGTVSRLLGIGADEVRTAIAAGRTMSDLAAERGVSARQVYQAIRLALELAGRLETRV